MTWYARLLGYLGVRGAVPSVMQRTPPVAAPWWTAPVSDADIAYASPVYGAAIAMSRYAQFPWVMACVRAIAEDLSRLPLVSVRDKVVSYDDPWLSTFNSVILRRQIVVDLVCTGNAYATRQGRRLHPAAVSVDAHDDLPTLYRYTKYGQTITFLPQEILHFRDVSWAESQTILGESVLYALHTSLETEASVRNATKTSASRGRAEFMLTARESAAAGLGAEAVAAIEDRYEASRRKGKGLFIVPEAFEATELSATPREMEYSKIRELNRDEVMALFGVPPARLALGSANYGTQKQQMRTYAERLLSTAAVIDEVLTRAAKGRGIVVEHDFSGLEALQVSYSERLTRVQQWIEVGADPLEAAKYEGFPDAPLKVGAEPRGSTQPRDPKQNKVEEPQGDRAASLQGATLAVMRALVLAGRDGAAQAQAVADVWPSLDPDVADMAVRDALAILHTPE